MWFMCFVKLLFFLWSLLLMMILLLIFVEIVIKVIFKLGFFNCINLNYVVVCVLLRMEIGLLVSCFSVWVNGKGIGKLRVFGFIDVMFFGVI